MAFLTPAQFEITLEQRWRHKLRPGLRCSVAGNQICFAAHTNKETNKAKHKGEKKLRVSNDFCFTSLLSLGLEGSTQIPFPR